MKFPSSLLRETGNMLLLAVLIVFSLCLPVSANAAPQKRFDICWTIYAGWMPWGYIDTAGIMAKWGNKYGIDVRVIQLNDYVESLNQYTAGKFAGCAMTNMDALTIPAAGGVDSTALIAGSFSDGNDGVVLKGKGRALADIKGMRVHLPELSVSHYLLVRALEQADLRERDVKVVNVSDADIVAAFATADVSAAVAWNPQLSGIRATPNVTEVFNSRHIPGEIIDLMVVNTAILRDNPALGKALTGAWYEVMALMQAENRAALHAMAKRAGTTLAGYRAQLNTTRLFYTPADNLAFVTSPELPKAMQRVARFCFDKGLFGAGARSADAIGITFPGNVMVGNRNNVRLRFDASYVEMAAQGKL